jgi:capsular polysaccharide biosynthesis protein
MELSYVWHAVKRFWWAVVICALLGTAFGLSRAKPMAFMSRASINVDSGTPGISGTAVSADRHVASEAAAIMSRSFADDVKGRLPKRFRVAVGSEDLSKDVVVTNDLTSNIVNIVVNARSAALAEAIANAYAKTYLAKVDGSENVVIDAKNLEIAQNQNALARIDREIGDELARNPSVTTIEVLDPTLATKRQQLANQSQQLSTELAQLPEPSTDATKILDPGSRPVLAGKGKIRSVLPLTIAAAFAGVLLAVLLARLSRRVLDIEEVEEILGEPVHARLPRQFATTVGRAGLGGVSPDAAAFLDELCTRVEASDRRDRGLTVLVAGSDASTNSVPLAAAMATRFRSWGLDVVFGGGGVEAAALFDRLERPRQSLAGVIAEADAQASPQVHHLSPATTHGEKLPAKSQFAFVGLSDEADAVALRRYGAAPVLSVLAENFDIVVLAVGSFLEARAAAQLIQLVDVVVLTVPVNHQQRRRLQTVARQLVRRRGSLIVIEDRDGNKGGAARFRMPDIFKGVPEQPNVEDPARGPIQQQTIVPPDALGGSA